MARSGNGKKLGRPSDYNETIAEEICSTIALTSKGIEQLCRAHDHWPDPRTVYRWLEAHRDFRQQYARAKEQQAHFVAHEAGEILDDVVTDRDAIMKAREQASHRRWLAEVLAPKKYGKAVKLSGDEDNPLALSFTDIVKRAKEE